MIDTTLLPGKIEMLELVKTSDLAHTRCIFAGSVDRSQSNHQGTVLEDWGGASSLVFTGNNFGGPLPDGRGSVTSVAAR